VFALERQFGEFKANEAILTDAMFELPSEEGENGRVLSVDRSYAEQRLGKMSLKTLKAVS
jgi:hypothetical protein